MANNILILLIVFQLKHLIADYYLQTPRMYENKGKEYGWFWPLAEHSIVHASFTIVIVGAFTGSPLITFYAFMFDLITHFVTDRWKATQPEGPDTKKFWTNLGWDQLAHHIVGIIIVYFITQ
jgi:hypothetical protein